MSSAAISRRAFVSALGASIVAGCGENPLGSNLVRAVRFSFVGQPDAPFDRTTVSNLPYASIAAKIGKGPRSLLILTRMENEDLLWASADNVIIATRKGRVVRTAGLPENLRKTVSLTPDPVAQGLHEVNDGETYGRTIDLDLGNYYGLQITSEFEVVGPRDITITEIDFETILVREKNVARTLNWSFENLYWVDPADGFVWKSRQHIARSFPPIVIEALKPAAIG